VQIPVGVHVHVVVDVGAVVVNLVMPGVLGDLVGVVREGTSRNTITCCSFSSCGSCKPLLLLLLALWRRIPKVLQALETTYAIDLDTVSLQEGNVRDVVHHKHDALGRSRDLGDVLENTVGRDVATSNEVLWTIGVSNWYDRMEDATYGGTC
jgi:hypothetical protein